jgi:hypothetical protein
MPSPKQIEIAGELIKGAAESVAPEATAKAGALLSHEAADLMREGAQLAKESGLTSLLDKPARDVIEWAAAATDDRLPAVILAAAEKSGTPLRVDTQAIERVSKALESGDKTAVTDSLHAAFNLKSYADRFAFYGG